MSFRGLSHNRTILRPSYIRFFALNIVRIRRFTTMTRRQIDLNIQLTETEAKIKTLLVDYCALYNKTLPQDKQLELRITGGWVRDKLLGDQSHDLDIAINHLSGEEFASNLNDFIISNAQYGIAPQSVHKIEKNPEKSKHLETCTTKLYGLDIDFVNLRSEEYTTETRIPIIRYGTPQEDALRRDATLNALFYNLQKSQVEDFTNHGIDDLQNGILRTPLEPVQTFLDDPLRVLRLIRFASRFNFIVEPNTLDAMSSPGLKDALINKISRERIGIELEKTLLGPNPNYGLKLINHTKTFNTIFNLGPNDIVGLNRNRIDELYAYQVECEKYSHYSTYLYQYFIDNLNPVLRGHFDELFEDRGKKLFWLTVLLHPYKDSKIIFNPKKINSTMLCSEIVVREGIKLGKHDFEPVSLVVSRNEATFDIVNSFNEHGLTRSQLGLYLRSLKGNWKLGVLSQLFIDFVRKASNLYIEEPISAPTPEMEVYTNQHELKSVLEENSAKYQSFLNEITAQGLGDVFNLKPLVDGKTLAKTLAMKPGKWMSPINDKIMVWQLDNVEGTTDECVEYVKGILHEYI